jgi:non-specific serine/threonine protein kinase
MSGALLDYWFLRGHVGEGCRWLAASLAIGDAASAPLRARALLGLGKFASRLGESNRAMAALEESLALYRALDDRRGVGHVLTVLGRIAEDDGNYAAAEHCLTEAQSCFAALGDDHCLSQSRYHLGVVAQGRGDLDLAMARYEAAQRSARATNDHFNLATTLWYQGLVHCARGAFAQAADAIEEALTMERALGDLEGAAPSFVAVPVLAVAVGLPDAAARTAGAAIGALNRQGLRLGLPERLDFDQALAHARRQLGQAAFDAAWRLGQTRTIAASAADIAAILAAARTHPATRQPADPGAGTRLTPREADVLRLVAQGCSNREIAAALFISVPTVKSHLTAVLGKLGLPSRSAATAYAHTHGLL